MNNIETYIDKEKFQFITSFQKIEINNTKGEKITIDFGELTIDERVFLSAFLTYVVQNDGIEKKVKPTNLYDIIFNFNGAKKRETSFHAAFITTISEFLRTKPHFVAYIVDYYNEIIDNKTTIYRTQLNRSEMDALYSLKFQRSYKSLCNVLYIIGVAKSNFRTQLNKISIDRFYNNSSLTKIRIKEIMEKLGIGYEIVNDNVYFGNGFNIKLAEKYASEAKKNFEKEIDELDIINNIPVINKSAEIKEIKKEEVKKEVIEKIVEPVEPVKPIKEEKLDYLYEQIKKSEKQDIPEKDFSDEEVDDLIADVEAMSGRTSINYQMKWQKHKDKIGITAAMKLVQEWNNQFNFNVELEKIAKKLHTNRDVVAHIMKGGFLSDKEGGIELKKMILQELKDLQKSVKFIISGTDKSYTIENMEMFEAYVYSQYSELMNL